MIRSWPGDGLEFLQVGRQRALALHRAARAFTRISRKPFVPCSCFSKALSTPSLPISDVPAYGELLSFSSFLRSPSLIAPRSRARARRARRADRSASGACRCRRRGIRSDARRSARCPLRSCAGGSGTLSKLRRDLTSLRVVVQIVGRQHAERDEPLRASRRGRAPARAPARAGRPGWFSASTSPLRSRIRPRCAGSARCARGCPATARCSSRSARPAAGTGAPMSTTVSATMMKPAATRAARTAAARSSDP